MANVNIKINGVDYQVEEGITILEAAHTLGIEIPTLCYLKEINAIGACRVCVVEVKGARTLVTACVHPVSEGMEINTQSPRVHNARRTNLQLTLSTHNQDCLGCVRSGNCELQHLCQEYGITKTDRFAGIKNEYITDDSAVHMSRDDSKCILCRRCIAACKSWQNVGCIGTNDRGFKTHVACAFEANLNDSTCVSCGQCIVVCPTGAITMKDDTQKVWDALADPTKYVVVQTAPSVRATLGEAFGMPIGTNVTGKMAASLRRLGFDGVFDTDFAADLTIMEEATEFLHRFQNGGTLPLITSCSPGWVKYCETFHPDFIPNLSTCKSPQQMFGATAKTYYAQMIGKDPKDIFVASIMPCTAKKFEVGREDQAAAGTGIPDVDVALTTQELARMVARAGIDFVNLPDEDFDPAMGEATGAGHIFGATGGVMEAALRTAVFTLTGKAPESLDFHDVRGTKNIKEATFDINGIKVRVCVASGLANCNEVLRRIKAGEAQYDFIEFMACPGGCVNGGGQPVQSATVRNFTDLKGLRASALYSADIGSKSRMSHENVSVKKLYDDFLGEPGGHKAHSILHTKYSERVKRY